MKLKLLLMTSLIFGLLAGGCATEGKENEAQLEAQAKVSRADAEKTALTKVANGKVKEAELEKENGKLVWSFDIATEGSKNITEVQVDAITGEIVSVETETPKDQEKEAKEKKKEKKD